VRQFTCRRRLLSIGRRDTYSTIETSWVGLGRIDGSLCIVCGESYA
jgi:hypothetical protein